MVILTVLIGTIIASGGVVALVFRRIQEQHKEVIARAERLGLDYGNTRPPNARDHADAATAGGLTDSGGTGKISR